MTAATTDAGGAGAGRGGRVSRPRGREAVPRLPRGGDPGTVRARPGSRRPRRGPAWRPPGRRRGGARDQPAGAGDLRRAGRRPGPAGRRRARAAGREGRRPGGRPPFGPGEVEATGRAASPPVGGPHGPAPACRVRGVARPTVHRRRGPPRAAAPRRPGPAGPVPGAGLPGAVPAAGRFRGGGRREVRAGPRRGGATVPGTVGTRRGAGLAATTAGEGRAAVLVAVDRRPAGRVGIRAPLEASRLGARGPLRRGVRRHLGGLAEDVARGPPRPRQPAHGPRLPEGAALLGRREPAGLRPGPRRERPRRAPRPRPGGGPLVGAQPRHGREPRRALPASREAHRATRLVGRHGPRPPAAVRRERLSAAAPAAQAPARCPTSRGRYRQPVHGGAALPGGRAHALGLGSKPAREEGRRPPRPRRGGRARLDGEREAPAALAAGGTRHPGRVRRPAGRARRGQAQPLGPVPGAEGARPGAEEKTPEAAEQEREDGRFLREVRQVGDEVRAGRSGPPGAASKTSRGVR